MGTPWRSLEERFWKKVDRRRDEDCWHWMGTRIPPWGHGRIMGRDGRTVLAHRVAWELERGPIPAGLFVCHRCDNPPCVNPAHLFLGTHLDNMQDMARKHRGAIGERNGQAKLSQSQVLEIRDLLRNGLAGTDIADRFGVSKSLVSLIKRGRLWPQAGLR